MSNERTDIRRREERGIIEREGEGLFIAVFPTNNVTIWPITMETLKEHNEVEQEPNLYRTLAHLPSCLPGCTARYWWYSPLHIPLHHHSALPRLGGLYVGSSDRQGRVQTPRGFEEYVWLTAQAHTHKRHPTGKKSRVAGEDSNHSRWQWSW